MYRYRYLYSIVLIISKYPINHRKYVMEVAPPHLFSVFTLKLVAR